MMPILERNEAGEGGTLAWYMFLPFTLKIGLDLKLEREIAENESTTSSFICITT